jgi:hypothetical protein
MVSASKVRSLPKRPLTSAGTTVRIAGKAAIEQTLQLVDRTG